MLTITAVALRQALLTLGFSDVYHYTSVLSENPRDGELWTEAMRAKYYRDGKPYGREEFDALLGHCMVPNHTQFTHARTVADPKLGCVRHTLHHVLQRTTRGVSRSESDSY